ncbi:MAG: (2Fe-2S) ferredoxin domain-containing protein [Calditrichaceae bacterium]|nr:(2Fe-2S) ferredoxin domain-containing protein [Calditrichaceae bacterium]MBN2709705.1 (2Fe-2S) ferredoxin domain-containing protein [Calditrichaceae bacterium]RQV92548.1 MAG: (2Fe-2S) ferredoxin domain-containing protein [Calditrichota bacterium]
MFKYEKHVFVCGNRRPPKASKRSCGNHGSDNLFDAMKIRVGESGLASKVRINRAGCLGRCDFGPTIVIYPQGIWYGGVKMDDIEEIIEKSILKDEIIGRLVIGNNNEKTDTP